MRKIEKRDIRAEIKIKDCTIKFEINTNPLEFFFNYQ